MAWKLTDDLECCYKIDYDPDLPTVGFDLDHTLIKTASGRKFPKSLDDWRIPAKTRLDPAKNTVVFTNQSSLKDPGMLKLFGTNKIDPIIAELGTGRVSVLIAGGWSKYRKPKLNMWDVFASETGCRRLEVYVGDAAGRKSDFSASDRAFAANLGCPFATPEQYFRKKGEAVVAPLPPPPIPTPATPPMPFRPRYPELVLMVGRQGAGKSAYVRKHIPPSYVRVSQDDDGSKARCRTLVRTALAQGKSVVVDNTHPEVKQRKHYLDVGRELEIPARAVWIDTPPDTADHLNALRIDHPLHPKPRVQAVAIRAYNAKFVAPTVSEGFDQVMRVGFHPDFDETPESILYAYHQ